MVRLPCWPIKRNKFRLRYSIILASDMILWDGVRRYRKSDTWIKSWYSRHRNWMMPIAMLLMAAPYLCERVGTAFPAITVQSGDRMCPERITKASALLFHLPEHGFDLKTAGICLYDISRSHVPCTAQVFHERYKFFFVRVMTWSRPGACAEHASHSMSMGFVRK